MTSNIFREQKPQSGTKCYSQLKDSRDGMLSARSQSLLALGDDPCEPLRRVEASISKVATPRPHISYRLAKPAAIQNLQPQVLKTSTRNVEQNQEKFAKETRNQYSSVDRGKEQGMVSQGRAESHEFAHDPTEPSRVTHDQPRDRAIQVQRTRGEARIPTSKRITAPHHQPTDSTKRL